MIEKVIHKFKRSEYDQVQADLEYWLSRPPEERVAAVEFLRRQAYGDLPRLQRVARIIKRQPRFVRGYIEYRVE